MHLCTGGSELCAPGTAADTDSETDSKPVCALISVLYSVYCSERDDLPRDPLQHRQHSDGGGRHRRGTAPRILRSAADCCSTCGIARGISDRIVFMITALHRAGLRGAFLCIYEIIVNKPATKVIDRFLPYDYNKIGESRKNDFGGNQKMQYKIH